MKPSRFARLYAIKYIYIYIYTQTMPISLKTSHKTPSTIAPEPRATSLRFLTSRTALEACLPVFQAHLHRHPATVSAVQHARQHRKRSQHQSRRFTHTYVNTRASSLSVGGVPAKYSKFPEYPLAKIPGSTKNLFVYERQTLTATTEINPSRVGMAR